VLGVSSNASDAEVKSAFRKLAATNHPDRNPDDPDALARFKRINSAYQVLGTPESRRDYDRRSQDSLRDSDPSYPGNNGPPTPTTPFAASVPPPPASSVSSVAGNRPPRSSKAARVALGLGLVAAIAVAGVSVYPRQVSKPLRTAEAAPPPLSFDDELTIRMACSKYQAAGDLEGLQTCRANLLKVAASTEAPSFEGLSQSQIMRIKVACDSHQLRGDLAAHRRCLKEKLAEPR
jgi:curved DNA-binding protein CbpA